MRLIGSLNTQEQSVQFSRILQSKGIHHRIELITNQDWGSPDYGQSKGNVWIQDEEQVPEAQEALESFLANPKGLQPAGKPVVLSAPEPTVQEAPAMKGKQVLTRWQKQAMGPITAFFLFFCSALLLIEQFIPVSHGATENEVATFFSSPIEKAMLYDFPRFYMILDKFLHSYSMEQLQHPENLPPEGQTLFKMLSNTPYWQGYYHMAVEGGLRALIDWNKYPPMFEKIGEGQIWRLFSPALLHANIFHLFFNMIWLIVLGKQMEQRLKPLSYILFLVVVGIFSNTSQYLMSGPNFLGFSGILVGMLTFIWMRQKYTPWEGYQLDRTTLIFMMIFIFGVAGLQLISFITEMTMKTAITPNIANTAHLSGALAGVILGKFNFFGWRNT